MPYRGERLYSTICPRCGRKMEELSSRRVRCKCGFEAHRDEVPFYWAQKRFHELTSLFPLYQRKSLTLFCQGSLWSTRPPPLGVGPPPGAAKGVRPGAAWRPVKRGAMRQPRRDPPSYATRPSRVSSPRRRRGVERGH
ncbi:MAG: hypothetical protein ACO2PN_10235 [Pyrobaculum sp.]